MILEKDKEIFINGSMLNRYKNLGYDVKDIGTYIIHTKDLLDSSHILVKCKCDNCGSIKNIRYCNYKLNINKNIKYFCNDCKLERIEKTNLKKYGEKSTLLVDIFKNKRNDTMIEKYGNIIPLKNNVIVDKFKKTNMEKYGNNCSLLNKNIKQKSIKTNIEKYGVEHYSKTNDFKDKIKNTILQKYGVEHYSKTNDFKDKINEYTINRILNKHDLNIININGDNYNCKCNKNHIFNINYGLLKNRLRFNITVCTICNPINDHISDKENKLLDFIKENYNGKIIENDRNIIKPYELDIYLPDLKLSFEFNGVYWHNELFKSNNYHKNKSDLCDEQNIQLIHIYEDDWIYKQDIVKSMILNKLDKSLNKIYARKTEVKEVTDNKLVREFLNKNHIQGFVGSKIKIGLFYKDELVSLMTFGKLRKAMNSSSSDGQFEMLRYCNKLNTNVIGGASKLFKYFIKSYEFKEITTYADRSYSNGKLYEVLGFKFIHKTDPNYYYVIDSIRYHRFNYRKDVLIKEGYDANKTEHQIMLERKIYRIYNSGNLKFEFII